MDILKNISIVWTLVHALIMFLTIFDSRYSKKKTLSLSLTAMIPLTILNLLLMVLLGSEGYMRLMLLSLSLPSLVFFWFLAKHRDGRFIFTFCMIDTLVMEIFSITMLIDNHIPGHWFMFFSRLIIFPLIELFMYKKLKKVYHEIQDQVKKGWLLFAVIGVLFYVAIALGMSSNAVISEHPEHLPIFIILLILMPVSYLNIFNTLKHQQDVYRSSEQENILRVQVADMKTRVEEFSAANNSFRRERHDFRHKLQTIARLVETKNYEELSSVVAQYTENIEDTKVKKYCENAVLDAVFASYIRRAELLGVTVTTSICFPDPLPVSDVELATVFANAIENAIIATQKLEPENRHIDVKAIIAPRFMVQMSNTFQGTIEFDDDGIPVSHEDGHGLGTRSIAAFCDKHNAYYSFSVKNDRFVLQIDFK